MAFSKNTSDSFSHHDILAACAEKGCPICRIGVHSVKRYMKSIFNEFVNDPATRDSLLMTLGFCGEHVQLLLNTRIADALGASIIYENIVKKLLREFPAQTKDNARMASKFRNASDSTQGCMACKQRNAVFDRSVHALSKALGEEEMRTALNTSDGLCFPHLTQVLEHGHNQDDTDFILTLTNTTLEKRRAEMADLIRKNDYQFQDEGITQEEALAWKKSMCMITGVSISPTGNKHG
jgi:hypothetical protein